MLQQQSFVPSSLLLFPPPPPPPRLPHHESIGDLSEGNISDTISESSDNATLLSLSREDLVALGAGHIREEIRVNRKKLEALIIRGEFRILFQFQTFSHWRLRTPPLPPHSSPR